MDTVTLFGRRLCLGCLLSYPLALITVIALWMLNAEGSVHLGLIFAAGLLLASFQLFSLLGHANEKWMKTAVKTSLGLGMGCGIYVVLNLPVHVILRWLVFVFLAGCVGALFYLRIRNMKKRCSRCEWNGDWVRCPGFNPEDNVTKTFHGEK